MNDQTNSLNYKSIDNDSLQIPGYRKNPFIELGLPLVCKHLNWLFYGYVCYESGEQGMRVLSINGVSAKIF